MAAGKLRRYHQQGWWRYITDVRTNVLNIRDLFLFMAGFIQSVWYLLRIRPRAVFTKGGYVSLPVGLAAAVTRKPLVIHESDVAAGLTNRILARFARLITTGFPAQYYRQWEGKPVAFVGNPVRPDLIQAAQRSVLDSDFDLEPNVGVILVLGGSSGALAINDAMVALAPQLTDQYQVLHVSGPKHVDHVREQLAREQLTHRERYHVHGFLAAELAQAYQAADCIITRAGANTLAEIAMFAKPAIVVANPHLTGGHQLQNAAVLREAEAAVTVDQHDLDTALLPAIEQIMGSTALRRRLAAHITQFGDEKAAEKLTQKIIQVTEE